MKHAPPAPFVPGEPRYIDLRMADEAAFVMAMERVVRMACDDHAEGRKYRTGAQIMEACRFSPARLGHVQVVRLFYSQTRWHCEAQENEVNRP